MIILALALFAVAAAIQVLLVITAVPFFTKIAAGEGSAFEDQGARGRTLLSYSR
jgi:hypothetical protein